MGLAGVEKGHYQVGLLDDLLAIQVGVGVVRLTAISGLFAFDGTFEVALTGKRDTS
jgi:hypothetical protein